jgi:adenylylsulfate kinase-like enzyme
MLIVITGPIASGKSTVASKLAQELERIDVRAVVIDLDLVHDRLLAQGKRSDESLWRLAREQTAADADALLEAGTAVVIAEGSFNLPSDRASLVRNVRAGSDPIFVTLRVSFEEALRRAQGDPTRGRSRDRGFLASHFEARQDVLSAVPATDIVIDTEVMTPSAAAAEIARLISPAAGGAADPG